MEVSRQELQKAQHGKGIKQKKNNNKKTTNY